MAAASCPLHSAASPRPWPSLHTRPIPAPPLSSPTTDSSPGLKLSQQSVSGCRPLHRPLRLWGGVRALKDDISPMAKGGTPHSQSQYAQEMLQQLRLQMHVATLREDYREAGRIQGTMKELLENEPALRLKFLIERAVSEERYEDAVKYRDELERLAPKRCWDKLKTYSDSTSQGIRVQVHSVYVSHRSEPTNHQYFFAYHVRISNESRRSIQLLKRHWVITNANGRTEHARGVGVIGEQPMLLPGTSFEYTSACTLGTPTGKMVKFLCGIC